MDRPIRNAIRILAAFCLALLAPAAAAAAGLGVSLSSGSLLPDEVVTVSIRVDTGGQSANAFEGTLSYPDGLFEAVRGSYSGSICTIFISSPDPSGGSASFACGNSSGFTGNGLVASVILKAKSAGTASFGLSGCSVLANDGQGTEIGSGCSGAGLTINAVATPPPATPTPAPNQATPKPTARPNATPTPAPAQTPKPAEVPSTPAPTPESTPTPPPVAALPVETPTPSPEASSQPVTEPGGRRTIGAAFQDLFSNLRSFKLNTPTRDFSGLIALLFTILPILGLLFAIVFFSYRLYLLERYRRRSLDRLFEMELAELASLEGKMDLLAEKGSKGREQYREEFAKAKERILQQVKPDFNKKVSAPSELNPPEAPNDPAPDSAAKN